MILDPESGIAFGWFTIVILIVVAGITVIVLTPGTNEVTNQMNDMIEKGEITEQTSSAYNFNLGMFYAVPIFTLIGLLLYGVNRALIRKNSSGGGM